MWTVFDAVDLFCITTNGTRRKNGALVMGAGIARQARDKFPTLDMQFGQAISTLPYGLLILPQIKIAAFQVKAHYRQPASLALIQQSTEMLAVWCVEHPTAQVALNFPGIGLGNLSIAEVLPIIETLPDQVQVWEQ